MAKIEYKAGSKIGECIYLCDVSNRDKQGRSRRFAKFLCSCGNEFVSQIDSVKRLRTRSCGCLNTLSQSINGKKRRVHGMARTKVYNCWRQMKTRCYQEDGHNYINYGGRGIAVCERWRDSFENFYEDIGQFMEDGLELDRIDVNGSYSPENCKWSTNQEQAWNQRVYKNNSTGCAGVTRASRNKNKFEVRISKDGVEYHIGTFNNLEDAIHARIQAEIKYYGTPLDSKRIRSEKDM